MDDEEDTPIYEIPVHISKRLAEKLYIFQYLNKFPHGSTSKENVKKCFVKPKFQEVSLETGLDSESMNFDPSKAENFAVNVDGVTHLITERNAEKPFYDGTIMDKQIFKSTRAVSDSNNYAVGIVTQNEIHLTPIKSILHLRPSLEHLDKSDKRSKLIKEQQQKQNSESGDEDEAGPSTEPEKVTVRFARTESDRDKKIRELSVENHLKQIAEEPWVETRWFHSDTCEAELERMNLFATQTQDNRHTLELPMNDYAKHLIPPAEQFYPQELSSDSVISLAALRELPLVEQCKNIIKDAKVLEFENIVQLLSIELSRRSELLKALATCAVLVRGLWIAKSELLYPTHSFSKNNGVPSEIMCKARDYILYLFTSTEYINRKKVANIIKIPTDELMEIFTQISTHEINKGWKLILPSDDTFVQRYPDIVQRQLLFWETKSKQFIPYIKEHSKAIRKRKKSNRDNNNSVSSTNSDVESSVQTKCTSSVILMNGGSTSPNSGVVVNNHFNSFKNK